MLQTKNVDYKKTIVLSYLTSFLLFTMPPGQASDSVEDYLDLPIEDLLSVEVTSVSKKKQRLSDAAAAVFVISQDDIRRSGVTTIPEALRMAPGLQVARIDANKWAITSRGFNGQYANKLLVVIDGRSVYTPAFSGVYWDVQDTLLEDIDRIEVIRGPGATLWGANAVNGVINIITKHTSDTQGALLSLGTGNEEKGFIGFRYGTSFGENIQGRFYAKAFKRDEQKFHADGMGSGDEWQSKRAGFRVDGFRSEQDNWTIQGDYYKTEADQVSNNIFVDPTSIPPSSISSSIPPGTFIPALGPGFSETVRSTGWNLLSQWQHTFNNDSSTSLKIYYDHAKREESIFGQTHETLDIDFQHNLTVNDNHDLVWGLGYRYIKDKFQNSFIISVLPKQKKQKIFSGFIQDQIELSPAKLYLTLGSKFEHNDYTGYEIQPSIRLLWKPDSRSSLWGSIARAARTPSRIDSNGNITTFTGLLTTGSPVLPVTPVISSIQGNDDFNAETLTAYELGYRIQALENLSFDIATYYNNYEDLRSYEGLSPSSTILGNKMSGYSVGAEIAVDWRPNAWWRLQANYATINLSLDLDNDSIDPGLSVNVDEGSSPEHQLSLRSSMDLSDAWELDFWVYHTSRLPITSFRTQRGNTEIDNYTSLNARLAWKPNKNMEFTLTGLNLQGRDHAEYEPDNNTFLVEIERSIYAQVRWNLW